MEMRDFFGHDSTVNLLPCDGTVNYFGAIMDDSEARRYFGLLLRTVEWRNDEAVFFGKHIVTARKVAWYGDGNYSYTYSGATKQAQEWTSELKVLKALVEQRTGDTYNSCLLNLYHNGTEGMAWHSDGEKTLGKHRSIASVTFGAERKFCFKHKRTKETVSLVLEHGSLLVMKDATQTNWLHRLPPTSKEIGARINLTFRTIVLSQEA